MLTKEGDGKLVGEDEDEDRDDDDDDDDGDILRVLLFLAFVRLSFLRPPHLRGGVNHRCKGPSVGQRVAWRRFPCIT